MIRLLTDENFDQRIIRGLELRQPQIDCLSGQQAGLRGLTDLILLESAARQSRILITHDIHTIPPAMRSSGPEPGC